jgi:hypothetical protein
MRPLGRRERELRIERCVRGIGRRRGLGVAGVERACAAQGEFLSARLICVPL